MRDFWVEAPVNKLVDENHGDPFDKVKQKHTTLPPGLSFGNYPVNDPVSMDALISFINDNYVAEKDVSLKYTKETIHWALCTPNAIKSLWVSIVDDISRELVAFIAGSVIPSQVTTTEGTTENDKKPVEIETGVVVVDFMCVNKAYRNRDLSFSLISEITRRATALGHIHAYFTLSKRYTTPLCSFGVYHRLLNVKSLLTTGFTKVPKGKQMRKYVAEHAVPNKPAMTLVKLQDTKDALLQESTIVKLVPLLRKALMSRRIKLIYDDETLHHIIKNATHTYYAVNTNNEPSHIAILYDTALEIKCKPLSIANLHYHTHDRLGDMLTSLAYYLAPQGYQLLNATEQFGRTTKTLEASKFIAGTGKLNAYFWNLQMEKCSPHDIPFFSI